MVKIILLTIVVVLFIAPLFSTNFLQFLGCIKYKSCFRPFAPNWLTLYSFILTIFGFSLYLASNPVWGLIIGFYGAMLDYFDGRMARALKHTLLASPKKWDTDIAMQIFADVRFPNGKVENVRIGISRTIFSKWWIEFNFPGTTDLGKVFDPFADKLKALSILVYFGFWTDILNSWLVIIIVAPEVFGTLLRRPFRFLQKYVKQSKASWVGKTKAMLQWVTIICCITVDLGLENKEYWAILPNFILSLTIIFAIYSILSRLNWYKKEQLDTVK